MNYQSQSTAGRQGDVSSANGTASWFYSDIVKEHFFNPRNFAGEARTAINARKFCSPVCEMNWCV